MTKQTITSLKVKISLQSDMCCGTGESGGGAADLLTAVDSYGLPIIPEKHLKGLLRESAELIDFDCSRESVRNRVFGVSGAEVETKARFDIAELANSQDIKAYLNTEKEQGRGVKPQQVTEVFTRQRSGTEIDDEGVAENNTLRTIQVVNRCDWQGDATVFVSIIKVVDMNEEEKELIADAVKALRRIGLGKSRGFGEVKCCVCGAEESEYGISGATSDEQAQAVSANSLPGDDDARLTYPYTITLTRDAVLTGGMGESLDYIPGSIIQGAFARFTAKEAWFFEAVLQDAVFSNAYIEISSGSGNTSALPIPFSLVMKKNASIISPEKVLVFDQAYGPLPDTEQYVPVNGYCSLVGDEFYRKEVSSSYSFHNSQPSSPQGKQFYSLQRISADQCFKGTVSASARNIDLLRQTVDQWGLQFSVGSSNGTSLGQCEFAFDQQPKATEKLELSETTIVELVSDLIFIDKNGYNSTNSDEFLEQLSLNGELGFSFDASKSQTFTRTATIGGYNSYWKLPKRQFKAFAKGSVFVLRGCSPASSNSGDIVDRAISSGLLQNEGFGQLFIRDSFEESEAPKAREFELKPGVQESSQSEQNGYSDASIESFKSTLDYNELRAIAVAAAIKDAQRSELHNLSKSAAVRFFRVYQAARTKPAENDEPLTLRFVSLAQDDFITIKDGKNVSNEVNQTLFSSANSAKESLRKILGNSTLSTQQQNSLFDVYIQNYVHQLKIVSSLGREQ